MEPKMTPERRAAIEHALRLMEKGLAWRDVPPRFTRDEMHERGSVTDAVLLGRSAAGDRGDASDM
jgi:hypothetical protein